MGPFFLNQFYSLLMNGVEPQLCVPADVGFIFKTSFLSSFPLAKHKHVVLWYTGVHFRVYCLFTKGSIVCILQGTVWWMRLSATNWNTHVRPTHNVVHDICDWFPTQQAAFHSQQVHHLPFIIQLEKITFYCNLISSACV